MTQRRKRQRAKAITLARTRARSNTHATPALENPARQPGSIALDVLPSYPAKTPQTRVWRDSYVYLILILPILVLTRNTSYIYSAAGTLDPWVYYGYMKHLVPFKGSLFPGTYYGSRLSWVLPGALFHAILGPVPANYLLHLTVFFTAIFSLYWLLKEAFDRRIAILSAICLALYPYFWSALGWDYVDGAGIAYYLLSMALLFGAARRTSKHNCWLLMGAGMAYAGMIYTNIAWLLFSPGFLALYLWLAPEFAIKEIFKSTFRFLLWFGIGWTFVTTLLGVINWFLEGTFWFYAPSVFFALSSVGPKNPTQPPNYSWIKNAYWLVLPGLACLCSLVICVRNFRRRDMRLFFALNLLYSAAVLVYLEVSGRPGTLKLSYYASYLIPSSILAVGAGLFESTSSFRESRFRLILAGALTGLLSVWTFTTVPFMSTLTLNHMTLLLFAGVGMTAVGVLLGRRSTGVIFGLAGLTFLCVSLKAVSLPAGTYGGDVFRRISSGMEAVENARGDQSVRFWFNQDDPYSAEFHSLNSCYLWAYTAMNYRFPLLDTVSVTAGDFIVVPSSKPDITADALGAFASQGFTARLLKRERDESGGEGYWLNFFHVEPDRAHMAPLQISFDAAGTGHLEPSRDAADGAVFPKDRWQMSPATSGGGSVQITAEGILVETPASPKARSAIYPEVVASEPAMYRFVLRYRLLKGDAGFGALSHDKSDWLEQAQRFYRVGPDTVREFTVSLGRNERVWLLTTNNRGVHASSRYVIEELRAYRYENPALVH